MTSSRFSPQSDAVDVGSKMGRGVVDRLLSDLCPGDPNGYTSVRIPTRHARYCKAVYCYV